MALKFIAIQGSAVSTLLISGCAEILHEVFCGKNDFTRLRSTLNKYSMGKQRLQASVRVDVSGQRRREGVLRRLELCSLLNHL